MAKKTKNWTSRKLAVFSLVIICATFLVAIDKISPEIWAGVAGMVGSFYQIGNGMEHLSKR